MNRVKRPAEPRAAQNLHRSQGGSPPPNKPPTATVRRPSSRLADAIRDLKRQLLRTVSWLVVEGSQQVWDLTLGSSSTGLRSGLTGLEVEAVPAMYRLSISSG